MKNMKSAQEFIQVAPPGRYPSVISKAEAKLSKAGDPQLALVVEIADGPYAGDQAFDYIGTDGNAKGAGIFSKPKLRSLGIDVETDAEVPDAVLAQQLQGLSIMVDYGNEPRMSANPATGKYDLPVTFPDPKTGQAIAVMNLVVKGYSRVGGAPQQQLAPQQPVQQYAQPAPQAQWQQPAPQQFAQPSGPVFPPQPLTAAAPAPQAPPGWSQVNGQWVQTGAAPAPVQQTQATVPWAGAPTNGAPPAAPAGGRRGKRLVAQDVPPGTPGQAEN